MACYDQWKDRYESVQLSTSQAEYRAGSISINFRDISQQPAQVIPQPNPTFTPNLARYPPYHIGYTPGATYVSLPSQTANPLPVYDQHLYSSQHIYQDFTAQDLPPVLFRIEPFAETLRVGDQDVIVPALHDDFTGRPVITNRGATLRFFSFLPRYISWDVDGGLLEFWFRLDYRLEMNDILMRIEQSPGRNPATQNARNTFNMRRLRFREKLGIQAWNDSRKYPVKADVDFIGGLTMLQICLNSSMVVDEVNKRFLKPVYEDAALSVFRGYMDSGLPYGYFLQNVVTTIPSPRMLSTVLLRHRLQNLAIRKNRGDEANNYQTLDKADEPVWWNDRAVGNKASGNVGRAITELDGNTHTQFMERSIGDYAESAIAKRSKTRGKQV